MKYGINGTPKTKIADMLHSLLYPQDELTQKSTMNPPQVDIGHTQIPTKKRNVFTYILIAFLIVAVALLAAGILERQGKITKLEMSLNGIIKTRDKLEAQFREYQQNTKKIAFEHSILLKKQNSLLLKAKEDLGNLLSHLKEEAIMRIQLKQELLATRNILLSAMKTKGDLEKNILVDLDGNERVILDRIFIHSGPTVSGNVLMINEEHSFAVIDIGKKKGLNVGTSLGVYRDNNLMARLLVVGVDERVSVATIVPSWRDIGMLKRGDEVKSL